MFACSECSTQDNRISIPDSSMSCPCKPGFYDAGAVKCLPCHYTCYECNGPNETQCISCDTSTSFRDLTTVATG